jgi:protein-L-isoaspartate(D-aspartate) O-methyltransferase
VPLRWRGQTQSVALVLGEDGLLRSDTLFMCGFVPMIGQDWERSAALDSGEPEQVPSTGARAFAACALIEEAAAGR